MNKSREDSTRALIIRLGYDMTKNYSPAYVLALSLKKLGFNHEEIIQAVSLVYPINFKKVKADVFTSSK